MRHRDEISLWRMKNAYGLKPDGREAALREIRRAANLEAFLLEFMPP